MIGYIKGNLLKANSGTVILENNGIGYEIACSSSAYTKLVNNNGGEVYTYLQVKEDGLSLYGFESTEEKNMFLKLITVSGVGPKMGIGILSSMNINELAIAIASSNVKALNTIKGCGKKTAERIILELREKVSSLDLPEGQKGISDISGFKSANEDAIIALMTLGFSRNESTKAVERAENEGTERIEDVIAKALKYMN